MVSQSVSTPTLDTQALMVEWEKRLHQDIADIVAYVETCEGACYPDRSDFVNSQGADRNQNQNRTGPEPDRTGTRPNSRIAGHIYIIVYIYIIASLDSQTRPDSRIAGYIYITAYIIVYIIAYIIA